jgi:hypothetical protein
MIGEMMEGYGLRPELIAGSDEHAMYVVWSNEHRAWWRANRCGYSVGLEHAGVYSRDEAISICQHARDGWRPGEVPPEIPVLLADALACETESLSSELERLADEAACRRSGPSADVRR